VPTPENAACKNLVWREAGYYRCSLPNGHQGPCVPDPFHLEHDEEMARRLLAELDLRKQQAVSRGR